MWHAAENVWVARVGDKSLKKSPNLTVCYFSSVKIKVLSIKLFPRYGRVKRKHLVYVEVGDPR